MTFTDKQQKEHREAFIKECRQKAWGAACHADWISKSLDDLLAGYQKIQDEDRQLADEIKASETAIDYHTVENRQKRKAMQERRNKLADDLKLIAQSAQQGQQAMQQLLASVESSLALAAHAEKWEWKEVETKSVDDIEADIAKKHGNDKYRFTKDWSDRRKGEEVPGVDLGDGAIFNDLLRDGTIEKV